MLANDAVDYLVRVGVAPRQTAELALSRACALSRVSAWGAKRVRNLFGNFEECFGERPEQMTSLDWRDALWVQGYKEKPELMPLTEVSGWMDWDGATLSVLRPHGLDGDQQTLWTGIRLDRAGVEALAELIGGGVQGEEPIEKSCPTHEQLKVMCKAAEAAGFRGARPFWQSIRHQFEVDRDSVQRAWADAGCGSASGRPKRSGNATTAR